MSVNVTVNIDADKVLKKFGALPGQFEDALKIIVKKAAGLIEYEGKLRAPWDTGRLRGEIHIDLRPLQASIISGANSDVNYAVYVHEGTRHIRPRPYLTQAADTVQSEMDDIINYVVKTAIEK